VTARPTAQRWLDRVLRALAIGLFAIQMHGVAGSQLPTLLQPALVGSDTSNYLAAGLRLNAGHPLYGPLQLGDRPVPGYPDIYPAPLLSPPLVGVIWRPIALLPDVVAMTAWWFGGVVIITMLVAGFALRGTRQQVLILNGVLLLQVPLCLYLQPQPNLDALIAGWWSPVAIGALSGNLNTYLTGAFVLVTWAERRRLNALSGSAAALASALKLGPAVLIGWFAVRGAWRSAIAASAALIGFGILGVLGAGLEANIDYAHLALGGAIAPSALSLPDVLHHVLGVRQAVAEHLVVLVIPVGLLTMGLLRTHPRTSFTIAILTSIYSSPVVLPGNLVLLLAVASPWWRTRRDGVSSAPIGRPTTVIAAPDAVHTATEPQMGPR
jgi:hypothetical protein